MNWTRSSFCHKGNCVEVAWARSSRCTRGECVETAALPSGDIMVRDSKNPSQLPLVFTPDEWVAFIAGVKAGEFDV